MPKSEGEPLPEHFSWVKGHGGLDRCPPTAQCQKVKANGYAQRRGWHQRAVQDGCPQSSPALWCDLLPAIPQSLWSMVYGELQQHPAAEESQMLFMSDKRLFSFSPSPHKPLCAVYWVPL